MILQTPRMSMIQSFIQKNQQFILSRPLLECSGVSGSKGGWGWTGTRLHYHMHTQCSLYCKPNIPLLAMCENGGKESGIYESTEYNTTYA